MLNHVKDRHCVNLVAAQHMDHLRSHNLILRYMLVMCAAMVATHRCEKVPMCMLCVRCCIHHAWRAQGQQHLQVQLCAIPQYETVEYHTLH